MTQVATQDIKKAHRAHILAIDSLFVSDVLNFHQGINEASLDDIAAQVNGNLCVRRRFELEKDNRYRQILPYLILQQVMEDGRVGVWRYRREVTGGEAALHNKVSIGVGGHVDARNLMITADSEIDFAETVKRGVLIEAEEEVLILSEKGVEQPLEIVLSAPEGFGVTHSFLGFMVDDRDDVGTKHLAAITLVTLPQGWTVESNEDDIADMSVCSYEDLINGDGRDFQLEGWSQIIGSHLLGLHRQAEML